MRSKKILWGMIVCLALAACGGKDLPPPNPMGLSGKRSTEAEAAFARAHVLWDKNDVCSDPQLAEELLSKALTLEPGYAEAYVRRGLARGQLHDWEGAFTDLSRAIRLNPTADSYAFRGLISMRGGNYLGARKDFDRSLEIAKRQHRAWNFRGALNRLEGAYKAACDDFDEGCDNGDCVGLESAKARGECL
jgi:tetratricopeptide (TPR) repeat protein